jgi:hypothetical protein
MSLPMIGESVRIAYAREFPFVVSIKRINPSNEEPEKDHVCTGVLVSNQDIVTISHCFEHLRLYNTEVIIGSNNIRYGTTYYVSWWVSYFEWSLIENKPRRYPNNEITMLRVRYYLNFNSFII